jgi:pimeloyl-ACP methyl ester carboxylesterase
MMTGEHDKLAPPHEIKSVATRIHEATKAPDVRFEMIQGAGHLCNVEAPDAYSRPMLEFLHRVVQ